MLTSPLCLPQELCTSSSNTVLSLSAVCSSSSSAPSRAKLPDFRPGRPADSQSPGMMASVLIFSMVGTEARKNWISRLRRKGTPLNFTKKNRRIVMIWSRFGLGGIAFFTPVIFSPIIGTMLAVSFGVPTRRIVPAMLASALFWGLAFTYIVHVAGEKIFG